VSFTCPKCGRTSRHPEDERAGYCGACHAWTGDPAALLAAYVAELNAQLQPIAEALIAAYQRAAAMIGANLAVSVRELTAALEASRGVRAERGDPTGDGPVVPGG
jgi:hypothetical protein